jgi:hypothetical protein
MNNKKFLIIFLCFVLLSISILPINKAYTIKTAEAGVGKGALAGCGVGAVIGGIIGCGVGALIGAAIGYVDELRDWLNDKFAWVLASIIYIISLTVHKILSYLNLYVLAPFINLAANLNPFEENVVYTPPDSNTPINAPSPIGVIWNILRNFAYIILVFSALSAGFSWLFNDERSSSKLIFNIIIVALLINFSFVLVKESFLVVKSFESGITGNNSGQIGNIIAASLWQRDPLAMITESSNLFIQQDNSNSNKVLMYLFQSVGYVFVVVLDMIIFTVLIVTAVLFAYRYIIMIFLAGTSPIAFVSLTFPEFKTPGLSDITSEFKIFNKWLGYFTNWLLVVPIFIILVILGNILTNNVLGQTGISGDLRKDPGVQFFEFIVILVILVNWYLLSLRIARKLSKGASEFAEKIAKAILLGIGGFVGGGILRATMPYAGSVLQKTGDFMIRNTPNSRLTAWMAKPALALKKYGQNMTQQSYESQAKLAEAQMGLYRERLEKETDDKKIAEITTEIGNLIQKYKKNPYVLQEITSPIDRMPTKTFEKIATNPDAIAPLLSPDLPPEAIEKINNKIKNLSSKTKLSILTNDQLSSTYLSNQRTKEMFIEEMRKAEADEMIEALKQASPEAIEMIKKDSELQAAVNKATKGLWKAIEEGTTKGIANSLLNLGESAFKKISDIQAIANKINDKANLTDSIHEALVVDPNLVFRAAIKSPTDDLTNILRSMDILKLIDELKPRKGSDTERYISMLFDI